MGRLELWLFAPEGGGWAYTYVQRPDAVSILAAMGLAAGLALLWHFTESAIESRPRATLAIWVAALLPVQWALHAIAPFTLTSKIESVSANGFLTVSKQYSAGEFLRHFDTIAPTLPMHVQANLPGKVLLYDALQLISERPDVLAAVLLLLSALGSALVYVVALQWFRDPRISVIAAIFYLLFPARILFLPLLNTISPLFMLIALALTGAWASTRRPIYAMALGPCLYLLALFDPLPLTAGLCGVAVIASWRADIPMAAVGRFSAIVAAGLLASHTIAMGLLGFDLVTAYRFAFENARAFNLEQHRPYWFWVAHNLKDFAIAIGVCQAIAVVTGYRRWLSGPYWPIGASILATLLIVDALGGNRGETQRLWMFLGVLFQVMAARAWAHDRRVVGAIIAMAAVQAAICIRSIGWVIP